MEKKSLKCLVFFVLLNEKPVQQGVRKIELWHNVCFGLNITFLPRRDRGVGMGVKEHGHSLPALRYHGVSVPCVAWRLSSHIPLHGGGKRR